MSKGARRHSVASFHGLRAMVGCVGSSQLSPDTKRLAVRSSSSPGALLHRGTVADEEGGGFELEHRWIGVGCGRGGVRVRAGDGDLGQRGQGESLEESRTGAIVRGHHEQGRCVLREISRISDPEVQSVAFAGAAPCTRLRARALARLAAAGWSRLPSSA